MVSNTGNQNPYFTCHVNVNKNTLQLRRAKAVTSSLATTILAIHFANWIFLPDIGLTNPALFSRDHVIRGSAVKQWPSRLQYRPWWIWYLTRYTLCGVSKLLNHWLWYYRVVGSAQLALAVWAMIFYTRAWHWFNFAWFLGLEPKVESHATSEPPPIRQLWNHYLKNL